MEIRKFTDSALKEAERIKINKKFLENRPIVEGYTIDGPTSKDLDDGLFFSKSGNNYLLEISIADVGSAIKLYSELFRIAYDRIETRYLTDYNIPMLPVILSENRLSLLPGHLRPAITFFMEITPEGEVVNLEIKETAFKNIRRLSYKAFDIIARTDKDDPDHELFAEMINMAEYLLDRRRNKGALAIYDLKKGIYTNEEGIILPLKKGRSHYGNLVIQEFSILTNKAVGWFFAKNDIPILFRNHTTKQSTPDRKDILAQINTAIMHPQHLNALRQRSLLWFNRANYAPVVRGHFGLNEPVYTHVTSPIRRLADLINHYVIKSYIHNSESPLKFSQLESMAKDINQGILLIKKEKVEYLIEKTEETSLQILSNYSEDEIEYLKENEFTNVLRIAVKNDIISEKLKNVLINRFKTNKIDTTMLYIILFKSNSDSINWLDFKKEALFYIKQTKGMSTQLLNILQQKGIIKNYVVDVKKNDDNFFAKTIANYGEKLIVTENESVSIRKKDAINHSSFEFLKLLLNIHLPENDESDINTENNKIEETKTEKIDDKNKKEITKITKSNIKDEQYFADLQKLKEHFEKGIKFNVEDSADNKSQNEETEENYVGQLQEICVKNPKLSTAHFDFSVEGMSHSPIITCFATIVTPDLTIDRKAVAHSKKKAKQEAARKLLRVIKNKKLDVIEEVSDSKKINKNNYVGKLLEFCMKAKLPPPDFNFNKLGKEHDSVFECSLSINILGEIKEFTAYAHSKKKAKHHACEKCYKFLTDNYEIDESSKVTY